MRNARAFLFYLIFYNPCLHSIFFSDMAGFAFSVDLLVSRGGNASMPYWVGHEEDEFIKSLGVEYQDLEPRFGNKSNSVFAFFVGKRYSIIPSFLVLQLIPSGLAASHSVTFPLFVGVDT